MSEIYIFYLVSSGTHTSLGTCTDYSIIYISKTLYTAGIEGSQTVWEKHSKAHTETEQVFKWAAHSLAAFLHFLPDIIIKNWKLKFSNFNCSAAKITISFQLQHGFTKIKLKQNKQNSAKLLLKRNGFSQTGWDLLNDSWPEASHPRGMRFSKFWLAGKPTLHNNKYKKWLLFSVLGVHTPSSPTALSQPAQRISIRIEITEKIHRLRRPRLADLLHPRYQNDLFFQGKQLWTLKADKHCNLFLFYCSISYPKSSYQSRTETQNNFHCWKRRLPTRSSSNYCTSLVVKNGSVGLLLSSDLPGSPSDPREQQAHQPCGYTVLLLLHRGRLKPHPGAAGEEHTCERSWPCGHHTWQRPPVLTVPRHQFGSAAKIYKFTDVFFCLLPFLSLPWHQPAAVRQ